MVKYNGHNLVAMAWPLAGMVGHWPWQAIHVASCLIHSLSPSTITFLSSILRLHRLANFARTSILFFFPNMDLSRLTAEQLTQFQSFLQILHTPSQDSSVTAVSSSTASSTASSQLPTISSVPSQTRDISQGPHQARPPHPSTSTALTAPISSYNGMRTTQNTVMTSQGHPSLGAVGPSSQPFLGLDRLGLSMAGQTNQRRLSSAATSLPRQPRLPRRGRGPAIAAPSLRRSSGPRIEDCLSIPDPQGNPTIRIKVKVYPPQVSSSMVLCM